MAREEEEAGASGLVAVAGEEEGERLGGEGRGLAPPLARIARSLTNRVMWSAQLVLSLGFRADYPVCTPSLERFAASDGSLAQLMFKRQWFVQK
jgi:hypothetical protein